MAVPFDVDALRTIVRTGIDAQQERWDRLMKTPKGRQQLHDEMMAEAYRNEQRALHPQRPLPPDLVAMALRNAADQRDIARRVLANNPEMSAGYALRVDR